MDALKLDTVRLSADRSCLEILDQTLLPGTVKVLQIDKIEDIFEAIRFLRVRGAPAIGVCAAYGIALTASRIETQDYEVFLAAFREQKKVLASSRPTAVNLFWALDRMERTLLAQAGRPVDEIKEGCGNQPQHWRDRLRTDAAGMRDSYPLQCGNSCHSKIRYGNSAYVCGT